MNGPAAFVSLSKERQACKLDQLIFLHSMGCVRLCNDGSCRQQLQSAKRSDVSTARDTMAESSLLEALARDVSLLPHMKQFPAAHPLSLLDDMSNTVHDRLAFTSQPARCCCCTQIYRYSQLLAGYFVNPCLV